MQLGARLKSFRATVLDIEKRNAAAVGSSASAVSIGARSPSGENDSKGSAAAAAREGCSNLPRTAAPQSRLVQQRTVCAVQSLPACVCLHDPHAILAELDAIMASEEEF